MRKRMLACLLPLAILGSTGCGAGAPSEPEVDDDAVRIASYDFTENQILAEIYAQALRSNDIDVTVVHGIGTRDLVLPALEQGQVDVVIDYLGAATDFVVGAAEPAAQPPAAHASLSESLAERGISVLAYAEAEDQNGFVVTSRFAAEHGLTRLSDLVGLAPSMRFGAPPECATRRFCLIGLQQVYGLSFGSFAPIPSRDGTVEALLSGEIDIGLLETTDGRLAGGQLLLLADDRRLQPRENVVPLVRTDVLEGDGAWVQSVFDAVTARLTTDQLIELNGAVEIEGRPPADVAADWVADLG